MKFNLDLAREILLKLEENPSPAWIIISIDGYSGVEISYHIEKLYEGGYVNAINTTSSDGFDYRVKSMTYQGHQFLDLARDRTMWEQAKKLIKEKGLEITIEIISKVLEGLAKSALGLS